MKIKYTSMKNPIIIVCLFVFFTSFLVHNTFAQQREIIGKVLDYETKKPLSNVKVIIKNQLGYAVSNSFGSYKIQITTNIDKVEFEELQGIKIKKVVENSPDNIDIFLDELKVPDLFALSLDELMNITVSTAGKKNEKISEVPASVVVITRDDIKKLGYKNLQEILENVPGFYTIDNMSENDITFGVRGFWSAYSKNMVLMIDGVSQLDFETEFTYPLDKACVPVESIERVEVIRGTMSIIYGSGAFLGAINVITRNVSDTDHINVASVSYGSENSSKASVYLSGQEGSMKYGFIASSFDSDGLNEPYTRMVSKPEALNQQGISINETTKGRYPTHEKYFNLNLDYKGFYVNSSHSYVKKGITFTWPSPNEKGMRKTHSSNIIRFGYKKKISKTLTLDGKLTYSSSNAFHNLAHTNENLYTGYENNFKFYESELIAFYAPNDKVDATLGFYYRSIFEMNQLVDIPNVQMNNWKWGINDGENINTRALYSQVNFHPLQNIILTAGLRMEQMMEHSIYFASNYGIDPERYTEANDKNVDDIAIIPRLGIIYQVNNNHVFKLLYGKSIIRSYNDVNVVLNKNLYDISFDFAKPELIRTYELNYSAKISTAINANFSIFRNSLDDLFSRDTDIITMNGQQVYVTYPSSSGKLQTNGFESTFILKPSKQLMAEISATYQKTENQNNKNIEIGLSPKLLGYVKFSYQTELSFADATFSITGNYVDKMRSYWNNKVNADGSIGYRTGLNTPAYLNMSTNIRLSNLFSSNLYLNMKTSNLLNSKINYPTYTINEWADKGTIGHGRFYFFTLGYEF